MGPPSAWAFDSAPGPARPQHALGVVALAARVAARESLLDHRDAHGSQLHGSTSLEFMQIQIDFWDNCNRAPVVSC